MSWVLELIRKKKSEKNHKLRIICDWDEVLKSREATVYYRIAGSPGDFRDFFQRFWEKAEMTYKDHIGTVVNTNLEEIEELRRENISEFEQKAKEMVAVDSDPYDFSPWLTIANDLLVALKEGLIEYLVIPGNYKKDRHEDATLDKTLGGDLKKIEKFNETFGLFPGTSFEVNSPIDRKQMTRPEWIQKNYPDFDIFIDDNPENILGTIKLFSSDESKIYIMPDYKTNNNDRIKGNPCIIRFIVFPTELKDKEFKPSLIIIAGGTSSGKSTTAKKIEKKFEEKVVNLCAENYISREDIHLTTDSSWEEHLNHHFKFNNSDRLEKDRLLENLRDLLNRKKTTIKMRQKDSTGISCWVEKEIEPGEIIVLEGINALQDKEIRNMADLKIYVEADENVRLMRKIFRSPWCRKILKEETTNELRDYGKSLSEALLLWTKGTNLSEREHVITTREYADLIVCSNNWQASEKDIKKIFGYIGFLLENNRSELKKQLPGLDPTKKKDGVYQALHNSIENLTKKIKGLTGKEGVEEEEIEALENSEEEIEELENLRKLLKQIQGEELTESKIEVVNK